MNFTPFHEEIWLEGRIEGFAGQRVGGFACLGRNFDADSVVAAYRSAWNADPLNRAESLASLEPQRPVGEIRRAIEIRVEPLEGIPPEAMGARLERAVLDPVDEPLWAHRLILARDLGGSLWIAMSIHHLFVDGVSVHAQLSRTVCRVLGRPENPPRPAAPEAWKPAAALAAPHWRKVLGSLGELSLGSGRVHSESVQRRSLHLDPARYAALRAWCVRHGQRPVDLCQVLFGLALDRFQHDHSGGLPGLLIRSTRSRESAWSGGCRVDSLPLVFCPRRWRRPDLSVASLVDRCRRWRSFHRRHGLRPPSAVERIEMFADMAPGRSPQGWVVFNWYPQAEMANLDGELVPLRFVFHSRRQDFYLYAYEQPQRGELSFDLRTGRDLDLAAVAAAVENLIDDLADRGARQVGELDPLRSLLLAHLPAEASFDPADTPAILQRWTECATARPAAVALHGEDGPVTARELLDQVRHFAGGLRQAGIAPGQRVGVLLGTEVALVVAQLGCWWAGCSFLALDPAHPPLRVGQLLRHHRADAVVTRGASPFEACALPAETAPPLPREVPRLDFTRLRQGPPLDLPIPSAPDAEAYVIHTSGSSGTPKGVSISHHALARLLPTLEPLIQSGPQDRWVVCHSPAFDFSLWEIHAALASGAELHLCPACVWSDPQAFAEFLIARRISILNQTPSAFILLRDALLRHPGRDPLALRWILFGGEALNADLLDPVWQAPGFARCRVANLYGITEITIHATWQELRPDSRRPASSGGWIGRPLADLAIALADDLGRPVPLGVRGEIRIAGPGLAREYLDAPETTAERFAPWPQLGGGRWYRSGDLARLSADHGLEYLGRSDRQVQLRGIRIEPAEIERVLRAHPGVADAVVVVREDEDRQPVLVGYVVPAPAGVDLSSLENRLAGQLPAAVSRLPVLVIERFPLTANGKLDPSRLPDPDYRAGTPGSPEAEAPARARRIAGHMAAVLRLDSLPIDADFFRHGGHSLRAAALCIRLQEEWQVPVPVGTVLRHPSARQLAEWIEAHGGDPALPRVQAGLAGDEPVLSASQLRVVALLEEQPDCPAYQFQARLDIHGPLDVQALSRALGALVLRHAGLRLAFRRVDGTWQPRRLDPWPVELAAQPIGRDRLDPELSRLWLEALPLEGGPLIAWNLFALSPTHHVLAHREHHLVHDGRSFQVLLDELQQLYLDPQVSLPVAPSCFDWAFAQRQWLSGESADAQRRFWGETLRDAPAISTAPPDFLRPAKISYQGSVIQHVLDRAEFQRLEARASIAGRTLHGDGLCALAIALAELSDQNDLCLGSGVANRQWPGSEAILGMLLNNLTMRLRLEPGASLASLAEEVREQIRRALDHQELPYEEQVALSRCGREPGHHRLCQVFFTSYFGDMKPMHLGDARLEFTQVASNRSAKFDLNWILAQVPREDGDEPLLVAEFNTALYRRETVEHLIARWWRILRAIHDEPATSWQDLPAAAGPPDPSPETGRASDELGTALAAVLHADAAASCIESSEGSLSAAQVDRLTLQGAARLAASGIGPGDRVGLKLDRGRDQLLWLLAILRLGAVVIPLDPKDPPQRLAALLNRGRAKAMVTTDLPTPTASACPAIPVDALEQPAPAEFTAPWTGHPDGDEALLFFTSGTSAEPKGVVVPRRVPVQLARALTGLLPPSGQPPRVLQLAPPAFDASTFELFFPLLRGGTVVCAPPGLPSARELHSLTARQRINTLWLTSTLFNTLLQEKGRFAEHLETLVVGGERLRVDAVALQLERCPGVRLFNGYGPTENGTFTTLHEIAPADLHRSQGIPIGRPLPGRPVTIEDRAGRPVPPGVPGELVCRGAGLARGYLDGGAGGFGTDADGVSRYRTGDLVRLASDGAIEFLGRLDGELKVRGHRVQPGEVEGVLRAHDCIRAAAVAPTESGEALEAFVVLAPPWPPSAELAEALRERCKQFLPSAWQPAQIRVVSRLPGTVNGKLDLAALRREASPFPAPTATANQPRSLAESRVRDLFADLLQLDEVPLQSSFFELGGHSLLALRLRQMLADEFGRTLPLGELLEQPTPRAIAERLGRQASGPGWKHALPIKRRGNQPILWWTAGGDGGEGAFLTYAAMAPLLPAEQPFWGLRAAGIDNDEIPPHRSVREMTSAYADEILAVQPEGPYRVGGECLGGTAAWELALELDRRGREVEFLILLDSYPPTLRRRRRHLWWASHCRLRHHLARLPAGWSSRLDALLPIPASVAPASVDPRWIAYQRTLLAHQPRREACPYPVFEFRSEDQLARFARSGWERLTPLQTRILRGDHDSYIRAHLADNMPALQEVLGPVRRRADPAGTDAEGSEGWDGSVH